MSQQQTVKVDKADLGRVSAFIFDQNSKDSDASPPSADNLALEAAIGRNVYDAFTKGGIIALKDGQRLIGVAGYQFTESAPASGALYGDTATVKFLEVQPEDRTPENVKALLEGMRRAISVTSKGSVEQLEVNQAPRTHMAILLDELARTGFIRFTGKSWLKGLTYALVTDPERHPKLQTEAGPTQVKQAYSVL